MWRIVRDISWSRFTKKQNLQNQLCSIQIVNGLGTHKDNAVVKMHAYISNSSTECLHICIVVRHIKPKVSTVILIMACYWCSLLRRNQQQHVLHQSTCQFFYFLCKSFLCESSARSLFFVCGEGLCNEVTMRLVGSK